MSEHRQVTHDDIWYKLGEIEAKVDQCVGLEKRTGSLEKFRAAVQATGAVLVLAVGALGAKIANLL